jgi:hypothetical protein
MRTTKDPETAAAEEPDPTDEKELGVPVDEARDDYDNAAHHLAEHDDILTEHGNILGENSVTLALHRDRIESMDRTLFNGLRGVVMLIDHLECAVNPLAEPEEKAAALVKVREVIDMMKGTLK